MAVFHDFDSGPPAELTPATAPAPIVIVQYQRPNRLGTLMPVLILVAILVVVIAQRDHRSSSIVTEAVPPAPAVPAVEPIEAPLVLQVKPLPLLEPVLTSAGAITDSVPIAEGTATPAEPPVEPREGAEETVAALASIRSEAARLREERAEMEALAARQPVLERQEKARARRAVEEQRAEFHRAMDVLLRKHGKGAARPIWDLALRSPLDATPQVEQAVARDLKARGPRLSRAGRIALFRARGLPEPVILAELVREQLKLMPSRRGPRNRDEAILRAARQLLATPLPGPSAASPDRPPTTRLGRNG